MHRDRIYSFLTVVVFSLLLGMWTGGTAWALSPREVVFIDPAVRDAQTIQAQLPDHVETVLLAPGGDALAQIASALSGKRNLSAIHIISHGGPGSLTLNRERVTPHVLQARTAEPASWGRSLKPGGDILLYACSAGAGPSGNALITALSRLTGADVAASKNLTGNGGDWNLEVARGAIETRPLEIKGYAYDLIERQVTSNADSGAGTLRQAITDANDLDTITFALGEGDETIILTSGELLTTGRHLTIDGANTAGSGTPVTVQVTDPGESAWRVFHINAGVGTVDISNMTVKGGNVERGGGICLESGVLNMDTVTVSGSKGTLGGGISSNCGTLTLMNCTISGNEAGGNGGGISFFSNTLTLTNCTISGNEAGGDGGGIYSSISALTLTNCTISGNEAGGDGGGIYSDYFDCYLLNSMVVNNTANSGGDLYLSEIASATAYYTWYAETSGSGTISGRNEAPNQTGTYTAGDLGSLADNGGPTQTMAVQDSSCPAVSGGAYVYYNETDGYYFYDKNEPPTAHKLSDWSTPSNAQPSDKITTDQRGAARQEMLTIGAYAFSCFTEVTHTDDYGPGSLRDAISGAADGGTITFNLPQGDETIVIDSELSIDKSLTINGANMAGSGTPVTVQVTDPGQSAWRVFNIDADGKTISLSNMTVKGGNVGVGNGGGILLESGALNMDTVSVSGAKATSGGGINSSSGTLTLTNCTISGNQSGFNGGGGGINSSSGTLTLTNCTISGNKAQTGFGGGVSIREGALTLTNATISGNEAGRDGGGIYSYSAACYLLNSMVVNNTANSGGDLYLAGSASATAYYAWYAQANKEISGNDLAPNQTGAYTAGDLGPLADYGGPTLTLAVLESSCPAVSGGAYVYHNETDGYYFYDTENVARKLSDWSTPSNPKDADKITTDQRGTFREDGVTIGACAYFSSTVLTHHNDGPGSLRDAIDKAGDGDTITFNLPEGQETITSESELSISGKSLTIDGANTAGSGTSITVQVTEPGVSGWRVFDIDAAGETINISNMTVTGGDLTGIIREDGAGIRLQNGTLNMDTVTVSGSKSMRGGGIFSNGVLTLTNCTVSGNAADILGGGICCYSGTLTLTNSTISGNVASTMTKASGGGICSNGALALTNTTVSGNAAGEDGGGIYSGGASTTLTNSTISGNTTEDEGGGIYSNDTLTLTNTTVSGNAANWGGGIYSSANRHLLNSIVVNNTGGDLCLTPVSSSAAYYCWFLDTIGTISGEETAPNQTAAYAAGDLGPLADNGGPTQTLAVFNPSCPAISGGAYVYYNETDGYYFYDNENNAHKLSDWSTPSNPQPSDKITTDQRGLTRENSTPTIGAYEPSVWEVTSNLDLGAGTLRNAIATAKEGDTILLNMPGDTINIDSELLIDKGLRIDGTNLNTHNMVTVQVTDPGVSNFRVFQISDGTVVISNMTVKGGNLGNAYPTKKGGAILLESGTLHMDTVTVSGSKAGEGGGIFSDGALTLTNCTISGNEAFFNGGGIFSDGALTLTNCTISGNEAVNHGGGIAFSSGSGAACYLLNSIVVNNTANSGGDISLLGSATATAYYAWFAETSGMISGNALAPNQTDAYTAGDLGPLADYGGLTLTMAVLNPSCPAVSGGAYVYYNETDGYYFYDNENNAHKLSDWGTPSNAQPSDKITTDQRGLTRQESNPTIGACAFRIFTVAYNGNGNTGGSAPVDENRYEEGDEVTVLAPGSLVRTGYLFNCWNTAANGGGDAYGPGDTFNMPGAGVTLYAQWTAGPRRYVCSDGWCGGETPCHRTVKEAVEAAANGTVILIASSETTYDGSFTLNADNILVLQGGWDASFKNPDAGTTTLQGAPKAPKGSLTLQNLNIVP